MSFPTRGGVRLLTCLAALWLAPLALADDWPQWLGPQRDGVWRETGLIDKFPKDGPKVLWRQPLGGGYAGPAVANGKVYVLDRQLAAGAKDPDNPFQRTDSKGEERVVCFDQKTGKPLWKYVWPRKYEISYAVGPRATPVVADGKVYALGAMGDFVCLNAENGELIWKRAFVEEFEAAVPVWGFAAHPLVDGDKVITLVSKSAVAVAFDRHTGKEKWKSLKVEGAKSEIGYCPPMIYEAGGKRQLIVWHPESLNSLDPETGTPYWSEKIQPALKANLSVPTPMKSGDKLFLTSFYNGAMLLELDKDAPKAKVVWKTDRVGEEPGAEKGLNSIMPTPYIVGDHVYGVSSYGELRCLELATGKIVWEDLRATSNTDKPTVRWANAFLTPQGDRWWLFNESGELILAKLSPKGYEEIGRAKVIEPTTKLQGGRVVVWSHPAYAGKCAFVRNDKEIVCVSLAAE